MLAQLFRKWFDLEEPYSVIKLLREQLEYERAVNKELTETLTSLLKPVPYVQPSNQELKPLAPRSGLWTRRRAELETADRIKADVENRSVHLARPDNARSDDVKESVKILEKELGIDEEGKSNAS